MNETYCPNGCEDGECKETSNEPPVALAKQICVVGERCYFSGSDSYDSDGTISKYEWDFGAGGEIIRDDDNEKDSHVWLVNDDKKWATKKLILNKTPASGTTAKLHVYGYSGRCNSNKESKSTLEIMHGSTVKKTIWFDPCETFTPTKTWMWKTFDIPIDKLREGENTFRIRDRTHWRYNNLAVGYDTDTTQYDRSSIGYWHDKKRRNVKKDKDFELMMYLKLTTPDTEGEKVYYTYSKAGDYDVTLTVTDDSGATDTKSLDVEVLGKVECPGCGGFYAGALGSGAAGTIILVVVVLILVIAGLVLINRERIFGTKNKK